MSEARVLSLYDKSVYLYGYRLYLILCLLHTILYFCLPRQNPVYLPYGYALRKKKDSIVYVETIEMAIS